MVDQWIKVVLIRSRTQAKVTEILQLNVKETVMVDQVMTYKCVAMHAHT